MLFESLCPDPPAVSVDATLSSYLPSSGNKRKDAYCDCVTPKDCVQREPTTMTSVLVALNDEEPVVKKTRSSPQEQDDNEQPQQQNHAVRRHRQRWVRLVSSDKNKPLPLLPENFGDDDDTSEGEGSSCLFGFIPIHARRAISFPLLEPEMLAARGASDLVLRTSDNPLSDFLFQEGEETISSFEETLQRVVYTALPSLRPCPQGSSGLAIFD